MGMKRAGLSLLALGAADWWPDVSVPLLDGEARLVGACLASRMIAERGREGGR